MTTRKVEATVLSLSRTQLDAIRSVAQRDNIDFPTLVVAHCFSILPSEVTKEERAQAKNALFAYVYGRST
jgi:DNA polymerase I-like protein with 3'-5' exonuclease and polymerase domains